MKSKNTIDKTCQTCIQVEHYYTDDLKEHWSCENCSEALGMPVNCNPPYNEACKNWTDDIGQKDKPTDALHYFIDHYWEDENDLDDDFDYDD